MSGDQVMKTLYRDFDLFMQVAEQNRTVVGLAISETWYRHNNMPTQVSLVGINRRSLKTWHVYVFQLRYNGRPGRLSGKASTQSAFSERDELLSLFRVRRTQALQPGPRFTGRSRWLAVQISKRTWRR
ncbi:hypothetical protein HBI25_180580 [Parastagonospora nodorum]|nr:hypothetical protein HBH51_169950 [Parastagonospora nodorum]KAH4035392.1 hypothetical protein HBI09_099040 [Parastagonospora nodorum]KAH4064051.1 hypothetical protein HBH50_181950 [Parastagonospora nodorum]KAH4085403.1 hypothetical protein HBH46_209370 [Parastagonospora nodorum]KAH4087431.1 hypothetical protein HBH48_132260 [Parastagonospora nodorum]